ncbi:alpha/beta hydrolase-fold protein [Parabacteroides sp. PF5-9]|uniref:carboxylesterase family protein n=1 Tax=Parabacteroides sp. PF5-9 TaxID=1742404 RepID=UPI002473C93F|nr:alpha/beta hydrolase-fold protein [Parabacteroides sp. PF5-9]MDH6358126.1 putative peptidase [Parabacteroides sp. PF5-9]
MDSQLRHTGIRVVISFILCVWFGNGTLSATGDLFSDQQIQRGTAMPDKSNDMELKALLDETVDKFVQLEFKDAETGKTMSYNLFIPDNYDEATLYPLVLFIADGSTTQKDVKVPLTQGYGAGVWATTKEQTKHPSFILVPQYVSETVVNDDFETSYEVEMTIRLLEAVVDQYSIDRNRLYTTGQSMGGMISMYFNITYPDLFAASIYVGCQWDTEKMAGFAHDKFFYIVAAGDKKAPKGMIALRTVLENEQAKISSAEWSAKLSPQAQEAEVQKLLAEGNQIHFVVFTLGSVLPDAGPGNEHMCSFDYAYKLEGVRDWLFKQTK